MAPEIVDIPQREWTLVASSVQYGLIDNLQTGFKYWQTFRNAGDNAPSTIVGNKVPFEAVRMFNKDSHERIASSYAIDVYVYCQREDGALSDNGKVRVTI